jgi:hypothetical protein
MTIVSVANFSMTRVIGLFGHPEHEGSLCCSKDPNTAHHQRNFDMIRLLTAIGFPPGARSVNMYTNRKDTAIFRRKNNTQNSTKTRNT